MSNDYPAGPERTPTHDVITEQSFINMASTLRGAHAEGYRMAMKTMCEDIMRALDGPNPLGRIRAYIELNPAHGLLKFADLPGLLRRGPGVLTPTEAEQLLDDLLDLADNRTEAENQ